MEARKAARHSNLVFILSTSTYTEIIRSRKYPVYLPVPLWANILVLEQRSVSVINEISVEIARSLPPKALHEHKNK